MSREGKSNNDALKCSLNSFALSGRRSNIKHCDLHHGRDDEIGVSQKRTTMPKNAVSDTFANRRCFLTLAIAAAAIAPMAESAVASDKQNHSTTATGLRHNARVNVRTQKTRQTATMLQGLWLGHIFWIRNVSIAVISKNESSAKIAEQQAVANARAIAASIELFYGAAAKDLFFKLLAGHYGAVKAYLVATLADDAAGQAAATRSLTSNAEEIATFLSKSNPYLAKDVLQGLLLAHGGHHIQQIQQLKDGKYEAEAQTWDEMRTHVYQIADATADALAKQFVKRFT